MNRDFMWNFEQYRKLILYIVETGNTFVELGSQKTYGLLVRYDVDYDMCWAREIAEVNSDVGLVGVFFVQVASPFYNLLTPANIKHLMRIAELGNSIGLHYYPSDRVFDTVRFQNEFSILRGILPSAKKMVAWHNPKDNIRDLNKHAVKMGFSSVYSDKYFSSCKYVSDSCCRNSAQELIEEISTVDIKNNIVQLLLHPANWAIGGGSPADVIQATYLEKIKKMGNYFSANRLWNNDWEKRVVSVLSSE